MRITDHSIYHSNDMYILAPKRVLGLVFCVLVCSGMKILRVIKAVTFV